MMNKAPFHTAVLLTVLGAGLFAGCMQAEVIQPIAFNHNKHTIENEIGCEVCHTSFETKSNSGRPTAEICSMCHFETLGDSAEEQKLVSEYLEQGKEIPWRRIFRTRYDVYYSHRRHVVLGELECKRCHGDIGESVQPPEAQVVMEMEECIGCHEDNHVTQDCVACHR